jgi:hypothetical protein
MKKLDALVGYLELALFALAALALLVGLTGSPGWGFLLLLLAGAAQVGRAAIEEVGLVRADGRSRALPILRRWLVAARHGAAAARKGAAHARQQALAARQNRPVR